MCLFFAGVLAVLQADDVRVAVRCPNLVAATVLGGETDLHEAVPLSVRRWRCIVSKL